MLSEIQSQKIIFGTAKLHHIKENESFKKLISKVLNANIKKFDIAPLYGFGRTEKRLSSVLYNNDCELNTKTGLYVPKLFLNNNSIEYFIKLMFKNIFFKNLIANKIDCEKQIICTHQLFNNKAKINSIFLHEPELDLISNKNKINQRIKMLSDFQKKYKINNIGIAGEHVLKESNLYKNLKIDTIQTSASTFMKTSYDNLIEILSCTKFLNLYGLRYQEQIKFNQKMNSVLNNLSINLKVNFLISTKFPENLNYILKEMTPILDNVN